jgi:hypothetical protein
LLAGRTAGPLGRSTYLGYRFIPAIETLLRRAVKDLKSEQLTHVRKDVSVLLDFWIMSFVQYSKKQRLGNWICFRPQVKGDTPILLGPLERANLYQWTDYVFIIRVI